MMIWQHFIGNTGYITIGNALVAAYRLPSGGLVLVDSGPELYPELPERLEKQGLFVRAAIHTHLHIDHVANNQLLARAYDVMDFYASEEEMEGIQQLEMIRLSFRLENLEEAMKLKYLFQKYMHVINTETLKVEIEGFEFQIIPLHGHSVGHVAVVTPDQVCCLGDAIVSQDVLDKSKLPYMVNVKQAKQAMEKIRNMPYPYYIIAHQAATDREKIKDIVENNILKEQNLCKKALELVKEPVHIDEMTDQYMRALSIRQRSGWPHRVMHRTAKARYTCLVEEGRLVMNEKGVLFPANGSDA